MKKVIKKTSIKKKQDGTMLDPVNIDPVRAAQMRRNAQTRDYVMKKAQLVKDQSAFSATLPEQIGGNRPLTMDELNRKNKYKSDISAYGDSIMMNRKNLSKEELLKQYAEGKKYGLKQKDSPNEEVLRGMGNSTQGCSGSERASARRLTRERNRKNGGKVKKAQSGTKVAKTGSEVPKAKDGKWMQKAAASIKARGTKGKCTPITKPGCTGKAKSLALTFKKIAKNKKKS